MTDAAKVWSFGEMAWLGLPRRAHGRRLLVVRAAARDADARRCPRRRARRQHRIARARQARGLRDPHRRPARGPAGHGPGARDGPRQPLKVRRHGRGRRGDRRTRRSVDATRRGCGLRPRARLGAPAGRRSSTCRAPPAGRRCSDRRHGHRGRERRPSGGGRARRDARWNDPARRRLSPPRASGRGRRSSAAPRTASAQRRSGPAIWTTSPPRAASLRTATSSPSRTSAGRYASDGDYVWLYEPEAAGIHARDGYDTTEWAAQLPGCDGRVGTFGQLL